MQVYIVPPEGEGLSPCQLTALDETGAALRGDGWELSGYTGALYGADGAPLAPDALRAALLREKAGALWSELTESGCLDGLLASARLLDRLLDALEAVPLLKTVIARLRED